MKVYFPYLKLIEVKGTRLLYLDVPESKGIYRGLREVLLPHNTQVVVLGVSQEVWSNDENASNPRILNVVVVPSDDL